jgi:DNA ligase-1
MNTTRPDSLRRLTLLLLGSSLSSLFTPALLRAATGATPDAPALPLAQNYTEQFDPALYLVSEKLDGVRALWDGSSLRFRSGKPIHAPAWFTAALPAHALDGELWLGRQSFERLSAAVRRQVPQDEEWRTISYQLYELPNGSGSFAERLAALQASVAQIGQSWLKVVAQERVADRAALRQKLAQVVAQGGEGLMLHRLDALWISGRTDALLKLKPQLDAEARVLAHQSGKGKYQGMLGALLVVTPEGKRFRLGSGFTDEQRKNPPPVSSMVTYRYRDLTASGLPRFASFLRQHEGE